MTISLCVATYKRQERLALLLEDLVLQERVPDELIIVDNDREGSALPVIKRRERLGTPFPVHYDIQPLKNISLTRNRTVELASSDWIAFIDDDERAPPSWLADLEAAAERYEADGVLGPVVPKVPVHAPQWIRRGGFYSWARMKTGSIVPPNKLRFGNLILKSALLKTSEGRQGQAEASAPTSLETGPFDPAYGLTGGEDGDLLARLTLHGAKIVWCDEAIVNEPVEASRLSLRWLLLRSLRGGQDFARHRLAGRYGEPGLSGRVALFFRALLQSMAAAGLALLAWPRGRHRAVYWLLRVAANIGKLSIFWGWHYREYRN